MPIGNLDEYDKVVNVSWFKPEKARDELMYVEGYDSQDVTANRTAFPVFCRSPRCILCAA